MRKRIDRQEFNHLVRAARDAYLRDIEAAAGDTGKVDLANKKLGWAEEEAREAFNQKSGLYRFFESTLIGKPIAILLDNVERGMAEYGPFLGLVRGLFIGLVIAVALVAVSEGVAILFDLGRNYVNLHWADPIRAGQREEARQEAMKDRDEHMMSLGPRIEIAKTSISYYPVDNGGKTHIINGNLTPGDLLDFLDRRDHEPFTSAALMTSLSGIETTPFFFNNKTHDVATVEFREEKEKCVIASLDGNIIFVPLKAWQDAGLPMHEGDVSRQP